MARLLRVTFPQSILREQFSGSAACNVVSYMLPEDNACDIAEMMTRNSSCCFFLFWKYPIFSFTEEEEKRKKPCEKNLVHLTPVKWAAEGESAVWQVNQLGA